MIQMFNLFPKNSRNERKLKPHSHPDGIINRLINLGKVKKLKK